MNHVWRKPFPLVALASLVAAALGEVWGCDAPGATPDCSAVDSGCFVTTDAAEEGAPGTNDASQDSSLPDASDAGDAGHVDGAHEAGDSASDAKPRDARAG